MGVSGTKQMAIIVASGTETHIAAVIRHVVTVPNRNTTKKPSITATPAQDVRIPRIDGWLKIESREKERHEINFAKRLCVLLTRKRPGRLIF